LMKLTFKSLVSVILGVSYAHLSIRHSKNSKTEILLPLLPKDIFFYFKM